MARTKRGTVLAMLAGLTILAFSATGTIYADEKLNRSIYVPVEFNLSDEFSLAVLLKDDEALRSLPGQQVFQFTFYPSLHRLVPETQEFLIKAFREDGSSVDVGLVVTPSAVYIGERCIQLDIERMLKLMKKRVDYRYEPVKLKIACRNTAAERKAVGDTTNP